MHKLRYPFFFLGGVILTVLLLSFFIMPSVSADSTGWLSASPFYLKKQVDYVGAAPIDCPVDLNAHCITSANYGLVSAEGKVKTNGSTDFLDVATAVSAHNTFSAIPNSDSFVTATSEPATGLFIYFNKNFSESSVVIDNSGTKKYKITRPPDFKLADKSGQRIAVDTTSLKYSKNSQWAIVTAPFIGTLRINLETYDVLPFGVGFNYNIGVAVNPITAISNDGRFAIVASHDFNSINLYDLSTCVGTVPNSISHSLSCQSRDLYSYLSQQIPGFTGITNPKFLSNDTISFDSGSKIGTNVKISKYILSTLTGQVHEQDYLALGDSYISGEGAYKYLPGTDTSTNGCHLSSVSYPLRLGLDLNFNSFHSVACSGAITKDITDQSLDYRGQNKGLKRKDITKGDYDSYVSAFTPGFIDQLDFVSAYQPKAITLSVGGNDIGFSNILKRCLEPDTCYSTYEDRVELIRQINAQFDKLVNTYSTIKAQAPPDLRLYVIGYPQIANSNGNCGLNVHLNSSELQFSEQLISYLNGVLKAAADKVGASYIDTQTALDGHKLCEAKTDNVAVNGLTVGNDFPDLLGGPIGKESYHPNELGHVLLEQFIYNATAQLTKPMPGPLPGAAPPSEIGQQLLNAPRSGRVVNITSYSDSLVSDTILRADPLNITASGSQYSLPPNSNVRIVVNSSSIELGTFNTDFLGNLSASINFPPSLANGLHTIHLYGSNYLGQPIDIYKTFYLAATADDYDGNSVPNSTQQCSGFLASGVDYDKDGLDDSCDPNITEPPVVVASSPVLPLTPTGTQTPTSPSSLITVALAVITATPVSLGTAINNDVQLQPLASSFADAIASGKQTVLADSQNYQKASFAQMAPIQPRPSMLPVAIGGTVIATILLALMMLFLA